MKYFRFILMSILLFNIKLHGENEEYLTGRDFKTSVIIPCCAKHAVHLYELLKRYENQTELPDEVVISLSESNQIQNYTLDMLQKELWKFPVVLILSKKKLFAGENRAIASEHATGDLLIYQDADDIPYPQRVQIIKYFFKKYKVDHLIHQWDSLNKDGTLPFEHHNNVRSYLRLYKSLSHILLKILNAGDERSLRHLHPIIKKIDEFEPKVNALLDEESQFFYPKTFNKIWGTSKFPDKFTNGNVAIARYVLNTVKWSSEPRGQDTMFNKDVYAHFENCIAVKIPLLVYRSFLSSSKTEIGEPDNVKLYSLVTITNS